MKTTRTIKWKLFPPSSFVLHISFVEFPLYFIFICVSCTSKNRAREVKLNLFENSIWHLRREFLLRIYNNKCWDHNKNTLNWFSHLALFCRVYRETTSPRDIEKERKYIYMGCGCKLWALHDNEREKALLNFRLHFRFVFMWVCQ